MNDLLSEKDDNVFEPELDNDGDYYSKLVGEGKKFKDNQDLAKGKYLADTYIKDLERQKDELRKDLLSLRDQYNAQAKLEEMMDQIKTLDNNRDANPNVPEQRLPPSMTEEDLMKSFDKLYTQKEQKKIEDTNLETARRMLRDKLGTNYASVVRERIEDLGMTEDDVSALARRAPKSLARLLGIEETKQDSLFQAPPTSQRRNDSFKPSVEKKTWSYYQNLKKTNPHLYLDPKTAVEMHNSHQALGSAFEDGDFHPPQ